MRRNTWHLLKAVALIGLINAAVYADDALYFANNEMTSLRADIEAFRARLDAGSYGDDFGSYDDDCCRGAGFFAGVELTSLKPFNGNGTGISSVFALAGTPNVGAVVTKFDGAPRFWLGYQKSDGLGVRLRYWKYNHDYQNAANGVTVFGTVTGNAFHGFNTGVLDLEVIDSSKLGCNWDATYSAGLRNVQYTETASMLGATPATSFTVFNDIDAVGPTASIELRRDITCKLGVFGIARGSILYGNERNSFVGGVIAVDNQRNDVKGIYEIQLGLEFVKPHNNGSFFVRGGFEAQYWSNFGVDNQSLTRGNVLLPSSNTSSGFVGGFFAAGLNW